MRKNRIQKFNYACEDLKLLFKPIQTLESVKQKFIMVKFNLIVEWHLRVKIRLPDQVEYLKRINSACFMFGRDIEIK